MKRPDSVTRRFVLALALVPIVPATSAIADAFVATRVPVRIDDFWWFHLFFTVFWMAGFILVWRTAILWTFGRSGLTALVSLIPFVQIVFNKPLWNAGCISDDLLRAGQHYTSCGLWTWLAVWVWWGMEKTIMAKQRSVHDGTHRRSQWLARLGASLGMFPCVVGLFLIVMVFLDNVMGLPGSAALIFWDYLICAIAALIAWCIIWRKAVVWSEGNVAATCGMWLLLVGVPIGCQFFASGAANSLYDTTIISSPVMGWGIWLGWTMWYWPMRIEPGGSSAQAPACMNCGYSLRGLKATRCPECGDEPTIDELWAASCSAIT
jgi:hypothetical protein